MLITFRNYLIKENKTSLLSKRLDEMAKHGQVMRKSYQFDREDLDFLQQFNPSFWGQAHFQRMQLLFKHLETSTKVYEEYGIKKLRIGLANYFKDRSDENKKFIEELDEPFNLSEEELERIGSAYFTADLSEKEIDEAADKAAHDHFKQKKGEFPVIDDPEYHDFIFDGPFIEPDLIGFQKIGGQKSKGLKVKANPYLLRLYHKLETTENENHPMGSAILAFQAKGKYGLDLGGAIRDEYGHKHATRGMAFPDKVNVNSSIKRYKELLAHRVFGEFDDDDKVKWLDSGEKDTFIREEILEELQKSIRKSGVFDYLESENKRNEAINKKAKEQLVAGIRDGSIKLRTPPYPPNHPNGIEITKEDIYKTKQGQRENQVETEDIRLPPLYLPYKLIDDKWVLQAKPGHFYKKITEGERNIDNSRIRGWKKNYLNADDIDDPTGMAVNKDGGIFINHNTPQQAKLIAGTDEFKKARKDILLSQKRGSFEQYPDGSIEVSPRVKEGEDYILPILQGVVNCVEGQCAGQTEFGQEILRKYIPALYQFAYKYIEDNLDSNKFYDFDKESNEKTIMQRKRQAKQHPLHNAVKDMAYAATMSVSQKAIQGEQGGRRQRAYTSAELQRRKEEPLYQYRIQFVGPIIQPHGFDISFSYTQENYKNYLNDLAKFKQQAEIVQQAIKEKDEKAQKIVAKRANTISTKEELKNLIIKTSESEIESKNLEKALEQDYILWLSSLARSDNRGMSEEEAHNNAKEIVKDWQRRNLSPKQMADEFLNHPLVKKFTDKIEPNALISRSLRPSAKLPNALIQKLKDESMIDLQADLDKYGGNINHAAIKAKYYPSQGKKYSIYVSNIESDQKDNPVFTDDKKGLDTVLTMVQKSINDKLGLVDIQQITTPSPPQAPRNQTIDPKADWHKLMRGERNAKNLFNIVFHPDFAVSAMPAAINAVEARIKAARSLFTTSDYNKLLEKIEQIRKENED